MKFFTNYVWRFSAKARAKRATIFRESFHIDKATKILDLGSEDGKNIFNLLSGERYTPENVYIADISSEPIEKGAAEFGFTPVLINESGKLPFPDNFFDIVFCSSVIEHVTVSKSDLWEIKSSKEFSDESWIRQEEFAEEVKRLGKQYFVQTPNKYFPIESHTWLPFVGYLPREAFLPLLKLTNKYWVKSAPPDFNLLSFLEMQKLFPKAKILREKKLGLTKSLMAIRSVS